MDTIVYISGKITGLGIKEAEENFHTAEQRLLSQGFSTLNPMKEVPYNPEWTWE